MFSYVFGPCRPNFHSVNVRSAKKMTRLSNRAEKIFCHDSWATVKLSNVTIDVKMSSLVQCFRVPVTLVELNKCNDHTCIYSACRLGDFEKVNL